MTPAAIRIDNVSKKYLIGTADPAAATFVEAIGSVFTAPLRRFRALSQRAKSPMEEFWALRDISFDVAEGEVVGIIGHNGAGKSTLLKILSRITEPTGGRIEIRGRVASLLEVGTGFHPELTGRENIFLNGSILGMTKREIRSKFDAIIDFSGIEQFLDTPFKRYSSGMGVRLAFAVAAHLDPEILIIDEVLAVGDAEFQKKCLGKMNEVAGSGRTILFVSHNMSAIENLCGRAVLLERGRIAADGSTDAVIGQYMQSVETRLAEASELPPIAGIRPNVEIHSADGGEVLKAGTSVEVLIELSVDRPISDLRIGMRIQDRAGTSVTTLFSYYQTNDRWAIEGRARIAVDWQDFNLAAGRYFLSLSVLDGQDMLARWDRPIALDVAESDYFGTGRAMPSSMGSVLSQVHWSLQSVP